MEKPGAGEQPSQEELRTEENGVEDEAEHSTEGSRHPGSLVQGECGQSVS